MWKNFQVILFLIGITLIQSIFDHTPTRILTTATHPQESLIQPIVTRILSSAIRKRRVPLSCNALGEEEASDASHTTNNETDGEEEEDDDKLLNDTKDFELSEDDFIEALINSDVSPSDVKEVKASLKGNGGNGSGDDDSDASVDLNEEYEEEDLDQPSKSSNPSIPPSQFDLQQQQYAISTIKSLWKEFIQLPPDRAALDELLQQSRLYQKVNGTDKETFYKQLLLQFLDPLQTATTTATSASTAGSSGKRIQWLDQEFLLKVKGTAVLSLFPQVKQELLGLSLPSSPEDNNRVNELNHQLATKLNTKAIRLISKEKSKGNGNGVSLTGNYAIHQLVVKALAHSLQARTLYLSQKMIEKIQELAEQQGVASKYLSKATILASLFALVDEENGSDINTTSSPLIVALSDQGKWLLHNAAASQVVLDEMKNRQSRVFFMVVEPMEEMRVGQVPPSIQSLLATTATNNKGSNNGNSNSNSPQNGLPELDEGGPPPGFSFPSNFFPAGPPVPPGSAPASPGAGGPPPGFFPVGQFFPGMPPLPPHPAMFGRSYQVVYQNGSTTITPLPPGAMPMMPFPPPPGSNQMMNMNLMGPLTDDQKKKILSSYQQFAERERQKNPNAQLPEMSEEDIDDMQEFLKDPDNLAEVKKVVDRLLANFTGSFFHGGPQGMNLTNLPPGVTTQFRITQMPMRRQASKPPVSATRSTAKPASPAASTSSTSSSSSSKRIYHSEDRDESSPSTAGKALLQLLEDCVLETPRDHLLQQTWDRLLDEEISQRIIRYNRRLFTQELRKGQIPYETELFAHLDEVLKQQVLSREQVKEIVLLAIKLQAGKLSLQQYQSQSILTEKKALAISLWAMDTAISSVIKISTPRFGKPLPRSKDEILNNLQLDKQERALVNNVISPGEIGISYEMIGGLETVKELLRQSITYPLKYPRLYTEGIAAEAVKGVLLFGPPGTGKTMLAKAVATEGGATFLSIDASTIENKWLGESEKNARAVFTLARKLAPCVIYLDEVDSILSSREHGDESSHGTLTSVKTTLMQEWDGLRTTNDRVVVIASTNRPFDLDEAVLRRLPRRIMVDLPDLTTRTEILAVTLANNRIDPAVNFTKLAQQLEGYSGSDIKEVCREAVVRVAHERALRLEGKASPLTTQNQTETAVAVENEVLDVNAPLRPVTMQDFQLAMKKLKASVDETGRELSKVIDWNEKYGEIKRSKESGSSRNRRALNPMYI